MKYYELLIALCKEFDIDPSKRGSINRDIGEDFLLLPADYRIFFSSESQKEIRKIGEIVNNLFSQASEYYQTSASESGYILTRKCLIIKEMAELFQKIQTFLFYKEIGLEKGFLFLDGLLYKINQDEEILEKKLCKKAENLRLKNLSLKEYTKKAYD